MRFQSNQLSWVLDDLVGLPLYLYFDPSADINLLSSHLLGTQFCFQLKIVACCV